MSWYSLEVTKLPTMPLKKKTHTHKGSQFPRSKVGKVKAPNHVSSSIFTSIALKFNMDWTAQKLTTFQRTCNLEDFSKPLTYKSSITSFSFRDVKFVTSSTTLEKIESLPKLWKSPVPGHGTGVALCHVVLGTVTPP